ncbi:PIN domain-containing protein [Streptomyces camelliae]|uniref:PIN domain-containing protein n=1 Tax=Streptomyces camelliae TaxID=3004093 RepID=A0ABY7PEC2_9ACTN|nr:PIN domain-containing protein [Streptomyces sp. HUAS 2-6]WBO68956.1 PIN domain-containing protein [Streptomyces sp. HUAS 2-6]
MRHVGRRHEPAAFSAVAASWAARAAHAVHTSMAGSGDPRPMPRGSPPPLAADDPAGHRRVSHAHSACASSGASSVSGPRRRPDSYKKSHTTSDTIKRRARGVFALIEQTLTEQRNGQAMAGGVRVEVLLDEPGHVRLPNKDDEIVARACHLKQAIMPTPVTVLTGDNGMRARALAWGLEADQLPEKYRIERTGCWLPFKIVMALPLTMVTCGDEESPVVAFQRAV